MPPTSTAPGVDRRAVPAVERGRSRRLTLPPELAATLLALGAVAFGVVLSVPAFGIFFGWAAASLTFGIPRARLRVLALCLVVGALFGAGTLTAQAMLIPVIGDAVPDWVITLAVLAVANPLVIALGRITMLGAVPGMFIGFSTVLAVHLGNLAPIPDSILMSLLAASVTNLIGLTFVVAYGRLTGSRPPRTRAGRKREPRMRA